MDQILRDRYTILVAQYPVDNRVLAELRNDILRDLYDGNRLRPDAGLILISLFDQMIIRPYHGPLPGPFYYSDRFLGREERIFPIPPKFGEMDDEKFLALCRDSLNKIVRTAKKDDDEGVSSHSILQSIDANWKFLSELFGWA